MRKQTLRVLAGLSALVLASFVIGIAPALANGSGSPSGYTEENDTNDDNTPNNVPDEGDDNHPSGKDRSTENGGSGNQGNSGSDPDDDANGPDRTNGGPDKPNGSGGGDLADQDGNNGCGNDDDFEDDNEGWCSPKPKDDDEVDGEIIETPCDDDTIKPGVQPCENPDDDDETTPDDVLGEIIHKDTPGGTSVLGSRVNAAFAALPFTGSGVLPLVRAGLAFIIIGALVLRGRRAN